MSWIFCINVAVEFDLVRELKFGLDDYAEQNFEVSSKVGDLADPREFINRIRREQVRIDVQGKPDDIVMCTEFEDRPATVKCEQCKDFFSREGFANTHATGKRKSHRTMPVEQNVCSVYSTLPASCEVAGVLYSDRAYAEKAAEDPDFRLQHKKLLSGLMCSEFHHLSAEVLCEQCIDLFCWQAFLKLHRKGQRQHHCPLIITDAGQLNRHGHILPKDESYTLIDKARLAREAGSWVAFKDDGMNSYWYNFADKTSTTKSPYLSMNVP